MTLDVTELKSRLNEQSELIMILKSRADSEMEHRKLAEYKLLSELGKNQELTEKLLECQQRAADAELNNRVLRSTLDSLSYELFSHTSAKQSENDISKTNIYTQTELRDNFQDKNTSADYYDEERLDEISSKLRELRRQNSELSKLVNGVKLTHLKNHKAMQSRLNHVAALISTIHNIYLRTKQNYDSDYVKWESDRQILISQLENEKNLHKETLMKMSSIESDKVKLENTVIKLKEAREREMKEFSTNKHIKYLNEELNNSKLELQQLKQDFEAYKIYAKELLDNEKRLNKELRQSFN
ncbi:unnamed protein product [Heterobilharzia americana]|nr:unnamed protein product [Heterobilharzia americana]